MSQVALREVIESDFPILFEHRRDREAAQMAAFGTLDPDASQFVQRLKQSMSEGATVRTILFADTVVGLVASFRHDGEPQVTYWIDRAHWGKGIASAALTQLLKLVTTRPLYASAAGDNLGSLRVLEKCGFRVSRSARAFANARGSEVEEMFFELR